MADNNLLPNDEVKSAWENLSNTIKEKFNFSISKFVDENEPRLDLVRRIIAPSGKEVYANIAFGVEFFRPFF